MRITKSQLKQIIAEALDEYQEVSGADFMNPGSLSVPSPKQKKDKGYSSLDSSEVKKTLHSVAMNKFRMLSAKDGKELTSRMMQAIESVLSNFEPESLTEEAPPGKEDQVKALKQEFCGGKDDCPKAFQVAWAQHNKSK